MPNGLPRTRLSRDRRRRQLLDTAWQIVAREGASALTLGSVAAQASVTKPVVYDHFGDPEGLLIALYQDFDARQTALLDAALAEGGTTTEERAHIIAGAYIDCFLTEGSEMPSVVGALAGSHALAKVSRAYQIAFISKCRSLLTPDDEVCSATEARYWAIIGAADALANAAVSGRIEPTIAKGELTEMLLTLIERSR